MKNTILTSLKMLAMMTLLTGIIYPLVMTGIVQTVFPSQANGSLVKSRGNIVGSALIAQKFTGDKYFWPRPSAIDYNPLPSGGSNIAPTNLALDTAIRQRRDTFIVNNHLPTGTKVPVEMLGASASGLDPHISPEAALLQVGRVARARNMDSSIVAHIVHEHIEERQWGIFGDPRVCVLLLNMALEENTR